MVVFKKCEKSLTIFSLNKIKEQKQNKECMKVKKTKDFMRIKIFFEGGLLLPLITICMFVQYKA